MEWNIPREGVIWAAKYTSSGVRRFSTLGMGLAFSVNPREPPWMSCRSPEPPTSSLFMGSGASLVGLFSASTGGDGEGRAKSAPAQQCRRRAKCPQGQDKRQARSEHSTPCHGVMKPHSTVSTEREQCGDVGRPHSVGIVPRDSRADIPQHTTTPSTRAKSAWNRLMAHVLPSSDPEPPPKPMWGKMVAYMHIQSSLSQLPPPSSARSRSPPTGSSTSFGTFDPQLSSRPTSAGTRPPSAALSTQLSPTPSPRLSPAPSPRSTPALSTLPTPRPSPSPRLVQSQLSKPDNACSAQSGVDNCSPQSDTENAQEGEDVVVHAVVEGSESVAEEQQDVLVSARSNGELDDGDGKDAEGGIVDGSRPVSGVVYDLRSCGYSVGRRSHMVTPHLIPEALSAKDIRPALPVVPFANEHWYRKGRKLLAGKRAELAKRQTAQDVDGEEMDTEFLLQRLSRPTASSRSRQVSHMPTTFKQPAFTKKARYRDNPNRFRGVRNVSLVELRVIVDRLSSCDPAAVPDSGRSRFRGKGYRPISGYEESCTDSLPSRSRSRSCRQDMGKIGTVVRG